MIYFYNEVETAIWNIIVKIDFFFSFCLENENLGIDILKKDIELGDFFCNEIQDADNSVKVASCNSFALTYNNKSGVPFLRFIKEPNEYSNDLFIMTYSIPEGYSVCFEKKGHFNVTFLKYDKEKSVLSIIAVAKPSDNPYYFLTFKNEDGTKFITKHLVMVKKNSTMKVFKQEYTLEEVEASEHKGSIIGSENFIKLTPNRVIQPYSVIVYPFSKESVRTNICEKRYKKNAEYTHYIDSEAKDLYQQLKTLRNNKYNAATFYIDKPFKEITNEDLQAVKMIRMFRRVNFICADGRITSI